MLLAGVIFCAMLFSSDLEGQAYSEIDRTGLLELIGSISDTTYVINFWATWCAPCVKEIPYFEELHRAQGDIPPRVHLVSLDFPDQAVTRLIPFLESKGITAPVYLMTDMNYNGWIDLVDPSWSGAIPATLIFNSRKRLFLEEELTRDALFEYVNQISD